MGDNSRSSVLDKTLYSQLTLADMMMGELKKQISKGKDTNEQPRYRDPHHIFSDNDSLMNSGEISAREKELQIQFDVELEDTLKQVREIPLEHYLREDQLE